MIRTDGYYITNGTLYNERSDTNGNWYFFQAYLFHEDCSFIKAAKFSKSKNIIHFDYKDFLLENSNTYKSIDNKIYLYFNIGLPWEHKEIIEELNCGEFIFENGEVVKFQSWEQNTPDG